MGVEKTDEVQLNWNVHFPKPISQISCERRGWISKKEAESELREFIRNMAPNVDMAAIAILTHGTFGEQGQVVKFSDETSAPLAMWSRYIRVQLLSKLEKSEP